ncbi:MAG: TonB-dependent receptor [Bacteroidia bacterium]|nr:TonB-dependent receptor [Bacteroidia bacterium]
MSKKNFLLAGCLTLFLIIFHQASAQQLTQTLRGTVRDRDSQTSLPGARIMVTTTDPVMGTLSDEQGKFEIKGVPIGRQTVKVTYVGYEEYNASELNVTSGKEVVLNVELTESYHLETVEITSEASKDQAVNKLATVSARKFSAEESQRYAASLNDPGRMASAFAGVQPSADGRNDIVIRGNSPSGLLWRMESVDIPNPNHFANPGGSGGGISMLSNFLLTDSDFLTGAFPSEYGNALGGVFDLKLRKGNTERHEFRLQTGVLGVDVAGEGPLGKSDGSYLVNYRYSTLGLMELIGLPIVQGATYQYQDLAFHLDLPTAKAGRFSLFGVGGMSSQTTKVDPDTSKWNYLSDKSEDTFGTDMGVVGFKHVKLFKDNKTYLKTVLSASFNQSRDKRDTLNFDFEKANIWKQHFLQGRYTLSTMVNHKFNSRHLIRTGIYVHQIFYNLSSASVDLTSGNQNTEISAKGYSFLVQPYFQWQWRISEKLTLNTGAHGMYFALNDAWSAEPRAGLRWQVATNHSLSFGYGLHSQILPLGTYFVEFNLPGNIVVEPNHNLDLTRAHHGVIGYDFLITPVFRLKAEAYYQHLFNVPVGNAENPTLSTLNTNWGFEQVWLVNQGKGRNYGLELTLEKFFAKDYYFLFTGSLYEAKYTPFDGIERNSRYNGNFALNFLGGKDLYFGKARRNHFEMSGRVVLLGGQRYTPIDLTASRAAGHTVFDESQAFQFRQKPYFRTDIRIAWHQNRKRASHILSFDVQNLFNTRNSFIQDYDAEKDEILNFYQAGMVPIIAYRLDFGVGRRQ